MPASSARALLLACLCLAGLAAGDDPRPAVLVIGDVHSLPGRSGSSWADLLAERQPGWRVRIEADADRLIGAPLTLPKLVKGKPDGERTMPGAADAADALLAASGRVGLVVIMLGSNEARAAVADKRPPADSGRDMAALLARLAAAPQTSGAKFAVISPLPVVEARLDQWSKDAFAGGEERARAISRSILAAAREAGATAIDAWTWAWERQGKDGRPGEVLGGSGWAMSGWAQAAFADWVIPQLAACAPAPPDAAAYAAWQRTQASLAELDGILAQTSAGTVRHGAGLAVGAARPAGKGHPQIPVEVPAALLAGGSLDLVVMPAGADCAVITVPRTPFGGHPVLRAALADGTVEIKPREGDYRLIDEAEPATPVPGDRYGLNAGKWQPLAALCGVPGKRRWLLLRFDLAPLAGREVRSAELVLRQFTAIGQLQRLADGAPAAVALEAPVGPVAVHPVLGSDRAWRPSSATWKTRDGQAGWTGGAIDQAARSARIAAFLAGDPPPEAAAAARASLE